MRLIEGTMRTKIAIGAIAIGTFFGAVGAAKAEMTSRQLLTGLTTSNPNGPKAAEFSVQLVALGINWANSDLIARKAPPIYCAPPRVVISPAEMVELLRVTVERDPKLADYPFGMGLLIALKRKYSCPAS
jgi:hypothetical protein